MSNPTAATAQQAAALFGQAVQHYQRGELAAAEAALTRFLAIHPSNSDAFHLFAVVRATQGRHGEAEGLFRRSLTIRPGHTEVLVNLGNTLSALGRTAEAAAAYRDAIRIDAKFIPAYLSLAHLQQMIGALEDAERSYRSVAVLDPSSLAARQGLAAVLNDLGRHDEAEAILRYALSRNPTEPHARAMLEQNLGVTLRLQNRFDEALERYDAALTLVPDLPMAEVNRGRALQQLGRIDEAVDGYRRALARNPLDMTAHQDLNQLLYRTKRDDDFLRSYDEAETRAANSMLPAAKAYFLMRLERFAEARDALERALKLGPASPMVQEGLGAALANLGEHEKSIAVFEQVLAANPKSPSIRSNMATALLRAGDAKKARGFAQDAVQRAPHDQNAIAVLGLAERALGDAHDEVLNDYERFVQVFDLEPPDGYTDMETFNRDLNLYLNSLHTDAREHFDQTLRGGTQTLERLFGSGHDLVDRVKRRIDEAVNTYIQRMKNDDAHPLLGRRTGSFDYSGSWSSRLNDCGFHTNHLHPRGWISSCYYIALPDQVADADGKQGWIKFGEPNFEMGLKDPVRRTVQPKAGRLVLFPSYMWHGTVPFRSSQSRTTIAFDAVPK